MGASPSHPVHVDFECTYRSFPVDEGASWSPYPGPFHLPLWLPIFDGPASQRTLDKDQSGDYYLCL